MNICYFISYNVEIPNKSEFETRFLVSCFIFFLVIIYFIEYSVGGCLGSGGRAKYL